MNQDGVSKKRKLGDTSPDKWNEEGTDDASIQEQKGKLSQLLEPFSRDQLVEILTSAATQYESIYNEIKAVANADIAHRKVFVRGLAWETNSETLKDNFMRFGDIEEGAVIFDKSTGKSRGFGFVTFADMEAAQRALKQPHLEIDGRKVQCNLAVLKTQHTGDDHEHQRKQTHIVSHTVYTQNHMYPVANLASLPKGASGESERKLFVRGLSWDTTTEGLRNEFQKYGEIEEASVIKDRKTGKSKGFGFVTFRYKNAADRALQQPNKLIDGRSTSCNLAIQVNHRETQPVMTQLITPAVGQMPAFGVPLPQMGGVPLSQMGIYAAVPPQYVSQSGHTMIASQQYAPYTAQDPYLQQLQQQQHQLQQQAQQGFHPQL